MPDNVKVQCANPHEIRLKITAEMPIGQWKEILKRVGEPQYYSPLHDLLRAIKSGIHAFESSKDVEFRGANEA